MAWHEHGVEHLHGDIHRNRISASFTPPGACRIKRQMPWPPSVRLALCLELRPWTSHAQCLSGRNKTDEQHTVAETEHGAGGNLNGNDGVTAACAYKRRWHMCKCRLDAAHAMVLTCMKTRGVDSQCCPGLGSLHTRRRKRNASAPDTALCSGHPSPYLDLTGRTQYVRQREQGSPSARAGRAGLRERNAMRWTSGGTGRDVTVSGCGGS